MSPIRFLLIVLAGIVVACNSTEPKSLLVSTPTRAAPLPTLAITVVVPTNTPPSTRVALPTAPAATLTPTVASTTRALATPTSVPAAGTMKIKLFFVALEDNGKSGKKIGCNDSIVAVERAIPQTQGVLTAALKELLSIRERRIGDAGLYNALAQANLTIDAIAVIDGKALINLSGTLGLSGVCDDPRVQAQLEELALQFATVKQVSITLNGIPLEKALSGKGN
jgi:hypothetical protein